LKPFRPSLDVLRENWETYVTLNVLYYGLVAATLLIAVLYEVALALLALSARAG
jgi:hypothetical protein